MCCIYHKTRAVGESSSEDDSDSSSGESEADSDDGDDGRARMSGRAPAKRGHRRHEREHERGYGNGQGDVSAGDCRKGTGGRGGRRKRSPNAYERMPRSEGEKGSKA